MSTTPYEPAFPVVSEIMGHSSGMSLRDYFAAKAMQGFMSVPGAFQPKLDAQIAYEMADAMLAERSKE